MVARAVAREVADRLQRAVEEAIDKDQVDATEMQATLKKFVDAVAEEFGAQEGKLTEKVEELQQEVANLKNQGGGKRRIFGTFRS